MRLVRRLPFGALQGAHRVQGPEFFALAYAVKADAESQDAASCPELLEQLEHAGLAAFHAAARAEVDGWWREPVVMGSAFAASDASSGSM